MSTIIRADIRARQRASLREAVCEVIGGAALTYGEIAAGVREDWGACSNAMLDGVLRRLWRAGEISRDGGWFVLVDRDEDEDVHTVEARP